MHMYRHVMLFVPAGNRRSKAIITSFHAYAPIRPYQTGHRTKLGPGENSKVATVYTAHPAVYPISECTYKCNKESVQQGMQIK